MSMISFKNLLIKIMSCCYISGEETVTIDKGSWNLGSTTVWKYKKYLNGEVECWGKVNNQSYAMTNTYGSRFYTSMQVSLPSVFNNVPVVFCMPQGAPQGLSVVESTYVDTEKFGCYVWDTTSETLSMNIGVYAKGTWR